MTQPGGGTRIYEYDTLGRLRGELYGQGLTEYSYHDWGLLYVAKSRYDNTEIRYEYTYHGGLTKEMKIRYRPPSLGLHKVKLHYLYDTSGRTMRMEHKIESTKFDPIYMRYNNQTGALQSIRDLRIVRRNILETTIMDQNRQFLCNRLKDYYGRTSQKSITIQGRNVFQQRIVYDSRGRISETTTEVSGRHEIANYAYTLEGQLQEELGTHKRLYGYDENGNMKSFTDNTRAEFLHYDDHDRVMKVGDGNINYDARGFATRYYTQNFKFNTKGQLIHGWSSKRQWSFTIGYDHLGRVNVYKDIHGNVTQFIYGQLDDPHLITHVHHPRTKSTTYLIYDDNKHLVALDTPNGRYYVATDVSGTPLAYFDENASQIYRQRWSSFGKLIESMGDKIWIGVGPWGHFQEPETGIVIIRGNAYHPRMMQWLAPQWQSIAKTPREVTDIYVYRFRNNNPINYENDVLASVHGKFELKLSSIL